MTMKIWENNLNNAKCQSAAFIWLKQ